MSEFVGPSQQSNPHGNQTDPNPATLGAIVPSGISHSFGLISVDEKNLWILDSCTTDYLTRSSEHFVSYIPCDDNQTIRIADGYLAPIAGKGKISPYAGLSLHNITCPYFLIICFL